MMTTRLIQSESESRYRTIKSWLQEIEDAGDLQDGLERIEKAFKACKWGDAGWYKPKRH